MSGLSVRPLQRFYQLLALALAFVLIAAALPFTATPAAAQGACGTAPAPRLSLGSMARVTIADYTGNNLRSAPSTTATVLGVMAEGEVFTVISGSQCVDNYYWWEVRRWDGTTGWTAEGAPGDYWVEPWPTAGAKLPLTSERPDLPNELIAYLSGSPTDQTYLPYLMDIKTGATAQPGGLVVQDNVLRWSPDGTHLAVSDGTDIYLLQPDGTPLANVTLAPGSHETEPTWSPDGLRIAFVSDRDGNPELYWQMIGSTVVVRLTNSPSNEINPAWSPDGTRLAYASDQGGVMAIVVASASDGANPLTLTSGPAAATNPIWSPDSRQIAYISTLNGQGDLVVINADGSGQTAITNDGQNNRAPAWSPDGTRIAYVGGNPLVPGSDALFSVRPDGTDRLQYTVGPASIAGVAWSPDGRWLAFGYTETGTMRDLAAVRVDGVNFVLLMNTPSADDTFPVWQPVPGGVLPGATPGTVVNPATQDLLLIYDAATPVFTLQNVSGKPLNLTGLSFTGSNGVTFAATAWTDYTASPLDSFKSIGCLMLWPYTIAEQPAPPECGDARQGWITRNDVVFWTGGSFTVSYSGVLVATCDSTAGRCPIDLP